MRVRILGAVEVFDGTRWRRIAPAKPRALLAALLTSGEGPVSLDRLGEELWGDRIPKSAGNLIQQYVMRLRRELGDGSARVLVTRPPGYQLALAADELDAARFERLLAAGRAALGAGRA
ncbi:MAG: hypothetical protein HOY76_32950, partial [Streptomyces sp.]|nr:hypothetical protein [Streptomyces sp.]